MYFSAQVCLYIQILNIVVNSVTKPDSFPLPRIEDCVDKVGAAKYVSKLDLLKGYWQVQLTSHASGISAFVTPDALHILCYGFWHAKCNCYLPMAHESSIVWSARC